MEIQNIQKVVGSIVIAAGCSFFLSYKQPVDKQESKNYSANVQWLSASQDLETIRQRIVEDLLQPKVDEAAIQKDVETIQPDGSWPGINYKDTTKTGFQHAVHLERMLDLARAYKKQDSKFYESAAVKKTLSSALDFWIAHDFICENWWWNEMGTPNWMINTLLLFDNELTDEQRAKGAKIASRASLTGVGARAGGDFVPIAGMVCKQGLFKRNDSILQNAIRVMTAQIKVTTDRGIKPDLSFHHRVDNVTSIHTYGTNYVSAFSYWAVKTAGTKYGLPDAALKLLIDYYLDGVSKSMAFGMYTDPGAKNRDLSRKGDLAPAGTEIPENLLKASNYRRQELEDLIKVRKGEKKPDQTWDRYYWWSSYMAHQRKNYYSSVRMHSSRQNNVEEPYNEEGLKMHHLADGSNFITRTGKEYYDIFPVWDWQKIPGATIEQKPQLPPFKQIVKKGLSDFVGAASDGEFGVAAFDFKSPHDPLTARKAWFFFDNEYVCLGTAIKCSGDYPVATTLNQCLLKGDVWVKTKSGSFKAINGNHLFTNVDWVLHDSVAYLFPQSTDVSLFDSTASGSWQLITHQTNASTEPVKKNVFTLWLNHGTHPQNESYAYVVLPAVNAQKVEDYHKTQTVFILQNTAALQAVQNKALQITQVVFYEPGTLQLTKDLVLTADRPCIAMVKTNAAQITALTISDPTHKLVSLQLKVTTALNASGAGWQAKWDANQKASIVQIDLPKNEEAGKSITLVFVNQKQATH
ncbi:polysaccharide lyase family 8 super-sandwich domain-containing protein [Flavisolibacter ginsenosidimutans]|uniref:Chondroitin lyase n=1 Tax=Flavisolibacter ginsenosidimutans TaxID=661481 RepID=A0A5B8UND2_9BACT|nr:polysaccharide lyase family 8 super-sandwich domain-containing protein [Flavisolibacter ginsenosidimutans]QEC57956.1 chondroitin lyase [Flavisolibacter ginsenosidimutans]